MNRILKYGIAAAILAVLLTGAWGIRKVNRDYPAPEMKIIPFQERLSWGNGTLAVQSAVILTPEELFGLYPELKNEKGLDLTADRILIVTLAFDGGIKSLMNAALEAGAWGNAIDQPLYGALRPFTEAGVLLLPFDLTPDRFSPEKWASMTVSDFQLILSVYPQKTVLCLEKEMKE